MGWRKWGRSRERGGWGGGNGVDQERGVEEMRKWGRSKREWGWTVKCNINMALISAHLSAGVILVVTV